MWVHLVWKQKSAELHVIAVAHRTGLWECRFSSQILLKTEVVLHPAAGKKSRSDVTLIISISSCLKGILSKSRMSRLVEEIKVLEDKNTDSLLRTA